MVKNLVILSLLVLLASPAYSSWYQLDQLSDRLDVIITKLEIIVRKLK